MSSKKLKIIIASALTLAVSCNDPKTVVTDIIHPDGSVTRKIEIKNEENRFEASNIQVPIDNTWTVRDSLEINDNGDTVWVKRAEKLFRNVEAVNRDYNTDSSYNKGITRKAVFIKKFRWFHTGYRFAEIIDKKMIYGYPVTDFLNPEELAWFYSPASVNDSKKSGPDSLRYKALGDTVEEKTKRWLAKSIVSEWIGGFTKLTAGKAGRELSFESLKAQDDEFVKRIENEIENFDSLWANGTILRDYIGEADAVRFKSEADSAMNVVINDVFVDFREYGLRIVMPGKVTGTNGFIDSTGILNWPVQSNYFLTERYEMWAESKMPNKWAWIVSGVFLLFVITGIVIKQKRKG